VASPQIKSGLSVAWVSSASFWTQFLSSLTMMALEGAGRTPTLASCQSSPASKESCHVPSWAGAARGRPDQQRPPRGESAQRRSARNALSMPARGMPKPVVDPLSPLGGRSVQLTQTNPKARGIRTNPSRSKLPKSGPPNPNEPEPAESRPPSVRTGIRMNPSRTRTNEPAASEPERTRDGSEL
jgi:hypothetical protein